MTIRSDLMMNTVSLNKIYYVVPDILERNIDLKVLLKEIWYGKGAEYIMSRLRPENYPIGGVKVGYQHCLLLNQLGFDAEILLMGKYTGDFFSIDVKKSSISDIKKDISSNDIVVLPEYTPYLADSFSHCRKIVFVQGTPYSNFNEKDKGKSYVELGANSVFVCSSYLMSMLHESDQRRAKLIPNFIDTSVFYPRDDLREPKRIMAMPRKNKRDLDRVLDYFSDSDLNFSYVDQLSESEVVGQYHRADLFLTMAYPEGFGLPSLEAMACNCVVVGYAGGGGLEYMSHRTNSLVAADGDYSTVISYITQLCANSELKESLRARNSTTVKMFNESRTKQALLAVFSEIMG